MWLCSPVPFAMPPRSPDPAVRQGFQAQPQTDPYLLEATPTGSEELRQEAPCLALAAETPHGMGLAPCIANLAHPASKRGLLVALLAPPPPRHLPQRRSPVFRSPPNGWSTNLTSPASIRQHGVVLPELPDARGPPECPASWVASSSCSTPRILRALRRLSGAPKTRLAQDSAEAQRLALSPDPAGQTSFFDRCRPASVAPDPAAGCL